MRALRWSSLSAALADKKVSAEYAAEVAKLKVEWEAEVDRLFHLGTTGKPAQSEVIGAMWEASGPRDVLLSAAGSHPGDLHKLWRTRTPNGYHMEYGYSCMAYEIPGAMGAKIADPSARSLCLSGRRHLPDDADRDRDFGSGRHQDHHRAGGQSRLWQHRQSEPVAGAGRDSAQATTFARRRQASWMETGSMWTLWPTPAVWARTPSRPGTLAELKKALEEAKTSRSHYGDCRRDGYDSRRAGIRVVVGCCGCRSF